MSVLLQHRDGAVTPGALHRRQPFTHWLEDHNVHTEFLDSGIGCCWLAGQGDQEPVAGDTEYEALERLAHENGWEGTLPSAIHPDQQR